MPLLSIIVRVFYIQHLCLCCDPRVLFGWFMLFFLSWLECSVSSACACVVTQEFCLAGSCRFFLSLLECSISSACACVLTQEFWLSGSCCFFLSLSSACTCVVECSISSACACVVTQEFCLACSCHFFLSLLVFHIQCLCLCYDSMLFMLCAGHFFYHC